MIDERSEQVGYPLFYAQQAAAAQAKASRDKHRDAIKWLLVEVIQDAWGSPLNDLRDNLINDYDECPPVVVAVLDELIKEGKT